MTSLPGQFAADSLRHLDRRIRHVDEERWLSSRYAPHPGRKHLIALYAFYHELARIRTVVTDPALAAIRFQWWRDTLQQMQTGHFIRHDVAAALHSPITTGIYSCDGLNRLIDGAEAAFTRQDRSCEPEAPLAIMAAGALMPTHDWHETIRIIAPHWAALRRGEARDHHNMTRLAPAAIRPAIAHFRLARSWSANRRPGAVVKRASILYAIMTGHV